MKRTRTAQPTGEKERSHSISESPFFFSFLAVLALTALEMALYTPAFLVNDDHAQIMLAKGVGMALEPDDHLIFMHFLLGVLLNKLYVVFPLICWNTVLIILGQFLAHWVFLAGVFLRSRHPFPLLLFAVGFMFIDVFYFLRLNYTITSALLFQGGCFLLAGHWSNKNPGFRVKAWSLIFTCLLFSYLLRSGSFWVSAVLTFPFIAWIFWDAKPRRQEIFPLLFIALSIFGAARLDDHHYDRDQAWKEYKTLYGTMGKTFDYVDFKYTEGTAPYFAEAGWSLNDLMLYQYWYFLDADIYSPEKISRLASHFPLGNREGPAVLARILSAKVVHNIMLCFLAFLLLLRERAFRLVLFQTAWIFSALLLLLYFAKAPERIYLPAFSFLAYLAVFLGPGSGPRKFFQLDGIGKLPPMAGSFFLALLLLLTPTTLRQYRGANGQNETYRGGLRDCMEKLDPNADQLYVVWGGCFPFEYLDAYGNYEFFRKFRIFWLSGFQRTPTSRKMLDQFKIKNLFRDMVDRKDIFIICDPSFGGMLRQYLRENFKMEIYPEKTFECPYFKVFRTHSRPVTQAPKKVLSAGTTP